jgi:hypothetical protein
VLPRHSILFSINNGAINDNSEEKAEIAEDEKAGPDPPIVIVRANYQYKTDDEDDLSFEAGMEVLLILCHLHCLIRWCGIPSASQAISFW